MGLFESALLSLCMGNSSGHAACTSAIQAGFKQSGMDAKTDRYEGRKTRVIETTVQDYMGKDNLNLAGGAIWAAKSAAEKKVDIGLPNMDLMGGGKTSIELTPDKALMLFKWSF